MIKIIHLIYDLHKYMVNILIQNDATTDKTYDNNCGDKRRATCMNSPGN